MRRLPHVTGVDSYISLFGGFKHRLSGQEREASLGGG